MRRSRSPVFLKELAIEKVLVVIRVALSGDFPFSFCNRMSTQSPNPINNSLLLTARANETSTVVYELNSLVIQIGQHGHILLAGLGEYIYAFAAVSKMRQEAIGRCNSYGQQEPLESKGSELTASVP